MPEAAQLVARQQEHNPNAEVKPAAQQQSSLRPGWRQLHQPVATLNNGKTIPLVGLGTWKGTGDEVTSAVQHAIRQGYRHIDSAAAYGNEAEVGAGIKAALREGGLSRDDVFVTTKLWNDSHGRVREACRESLDKFGLDYVDLYLVHWPVTPTSGDSLDPPYEKTWKAMEALVEEGLVKSIGVSNVSIKKLKEILSYAKIKPAVNQVEAHPYFRNDELLAFCKDQGIHVTAYSPLGSAESGKAVKRKYTPSLLEEPVVLKIAKDLGKDPGQVLVRWAVQRGTSVLPKSVKQERITHNIEVLDWELPSDAFQELSSLQLQLRMVDGSMFLHPSSPWRSLQDLWDDPQEEQRELDFVRSTYKLDAKVPTVKLSSGHEMPQLGLGTWKADPGQCKEAVAQGLRCGYRHIDCAEKYENQKEVGEAFAEVFAEGVVKREDVFIVSKLWNTHHAPADVAKAARDTLKDLQVEYLDLYLMHFPVADNEGPTVDPPLEDTWHAMERLVEEGLVKTIGVCNFSSRKLEALLSSAKKIKPAVNQVEVHPLFRNEQLYEFCKQRGVALEAYSPLGSPGSAEEMGHTVDLLGHTAVKEVAGSVGKHPASVLLRWGLQRGYTVLVKSTSPDHLTDNLDAFSWELSAEDMKKLSSLEPQQRCVHGRFLLKEGGPYRTMAELWDTDEK